MTETFSKRKARPLLKGVVAIQIAAACVGPFALPASAEPVVIATRVIHPGETLDESVLTTIDTKGRVLSDAPFVNAIGQTRGMVAERTILPQRLILISSLRTKSAIDAGALVPVTYKSGALTIRMDAVALTSAAPGQAITLRNRDTGRQIEALAQADGTAVLLP
ncbi:flagellar basal body P-ring formation chaperone FlgA [Notoacmeibacter sp. MSK16QG-6]|uniref:flagellar basal body P-ring formation chaperone FlgA n=1 Tax=Notoacmeibacter sp. MSK16QG-6 TaxID=2957982 RepID=UPI00209D5892|nr:flagellar basal body P-ring formation chaperone FlgA [Notoacmeibacter sp. MSK16QG-6]MCP1200917.1 flagellar basal body P-ring formation chaperone FlgA [Notoacmeibacter sp. MSK16QG-6]